MGRFSESEEVALTGNIGEFLKSGFMGSARKSFFQIGKKGAVASADQGIYSLANFVVNIFLARTLSQEEYGVYAIAFAIYLLVYRPYSGFILEPMSVLLPRQDERQISTHGTRHLFLHFIFTLPFSLIIIFISFLIKFTIQNDLLFKAILVSGLVIPFLLLFWLFRQLLYIFGKPEIALLGSIAYALCTILFTGYLKYFAEITASNMLLVFGFSNVLALLLILKWLDFPKLQDRKLEIKLQIQKNWQFGKWIILSAVFLAFSYEGLIFLFSGFLGLGSAGVIKAAQNVVRPLQIAFVSIFSISLPWLSRDYIEGRVKYYNRNKSAIKIFIIGLALIYEVFLVIGRSTIEKYLYAGNYSGYIDLFPLWGLVVLTSGIFNSNGIDLKAREISKPLAYSSGLIAVVSLVSGLVFIHIFGVFGLPISSLFGYVTGIFTLWVLTRKQEKGSEDYG